jgi:hypothetical protein
VILNWHRYDNFFDLYDCHSADPVLIYVIGESHHCYIGSVGSKGGTGGLAVRYESQYINRARAIFGRDFPENQPAFAAVFKEPPNPNENDIENAERIVQRVFLERVGQLHALFKLRADIPEFKIAHEGDKPSFLCERET